MSCKIKSPLLCGKDCTRIGGYNYCRLCRCNEHCPDFVEEVCAVRVHVPYVCNACPTIDKCTLLKTFYDAEKAHLKSHIRIQQLSRWILWSERLAANVCSRSISWSPPWCWFFCGTQSAVIWQSWAYRKWSFSAAFYLEQNEKSQVVEKTKLLRFLDHMMSCNQNSKY